MRAGADYFTRMWIEGDDDGWRVKGVRVIDCTTDDRAVSAMHAVKDPNAHH
jgi:hypothetical protein